MAAEPFWATMTVEQYLALDRSDPEVRYEYIDGIVTMMAGGSANHSRIGINLASFLDTALQDTDCLVFNTDMRVSISATRYVYPDVSVSCDPRDQENGDSDMIQHPCVVIEVLSPHTEAYDRTRKFTFYRACPTIQEIVFVSTQEQAVDLYRRGTEKLRALHLLGPDEDIELKSINVRIPVARIYRKVKFSQNI